MPALIKAVKSQSLVLVIDKSTTNTSLESTSSSRFPDPFPRMAEGIDGIMKTSGVLRFSESLDM